MASPDRSLVYLFRRTIEFGGPVLKTYPKIENAKCQYAVHVTDRTLSNSLAAIGCVQAKSLILEPPRGIPVDLLRHFLRGYFDGDGSICVSRKRVPSWSMISSLKFCEWVKSLLFERLGINSSIGACRGGKIHQLRFAKGESIKSIFQWFYRDATVKSRRKYRKFLKAIEWIDRPKPPKQTRAERLARRREYARLWRINNPEEARLRQRAQALKHREKRIAYMRQYRQRFPEKFKEYERKRALRGYPESIAAKERRRMKAREYAMAKRRRIGIPARVLKESAPRNGQLIIARR